MTAIPWRFLVAPHEHELAALGTELTIPPELLDHALDPGERPRLRSTPAVTLILLRIPVPLPPGADAPFGTMPLALFVTPHGGAAIATRDGDVVQKLRAFVAKRAAETPQRFVVTALELAAEAYLEQLDVIEARAGAAEARLGRSLENREVLELLRYQRSLVYFSVALDGMYLLLERLGKSAGFHVAPEDEDWLAEVFVEFRQAMETTNLQRTVLSEMMDAFASIISNNLNVVMKFLAAVTVILTVPMIVSSFYGMNVMLPGQHHGSAFAGSVVASLALILAVTAYFRRRGWL